MTPLASSQITAALLAICLGGQLFTKADGCLYQSASLYKSIAFCLVTLRFVSSETPSNC